MSATPSRYVSFIGLALVGLSAQAALASSSSWSRGSGSELEVEAYGAACDGVTIDTMALQDALDALSDGDTLVFPADGATRRICIIDEGLDLVGLERVTIDGNGATIEADDSMMDGLHMLKFLEPSELTIRDLTIDANATKRSAATGVEQDRVSGYAGSLMFYGVQGLHVTDVDVLDSWHDSFYLGHGDRPNTDVQVERLRTSGAGRNNVTIIDCTDCAFEQSILADADAGNFDIEPYDDGQVVDGVYLLDSVMQAAGVPCIHATNSWSGASEIRNLVFANNVVSECNLWKEGGNGAGILLQDVEDVLVESNSFEDIDLRRGRLSIHRSTTAHARSVVELYEARSVVVRYNHFDRIDYDPDHSRVFNFQNDSYGYQATHEVYGNELYTIPSTTGWCWVSDSSPFKADVQHRVWDNYIVTALQAPNPGCY